LPACGPTQDLVFERLLGATMSSLGRLILRVLVVPFGAIVAVCVAEMVVIIANWKQFMALIAANPNVSDDTLLAIVIVASAFFLMLSAAAFAMLLPAAIGIVIAEALAIRSWLFHAVNGGISAWVGWSMIADWRSNYHLYNQPTIIVAAGLAAGLAYWLVAGWSAGFWKPVMGPLARRSEPA
jgi:hypothetical protein